MQDLKGKGLKKYMLTLSSVVKVCKVNEFTQVNKEWNQSSLCGKFFKQLLRSLERKSL